MKKVAVLVVAFAATLMTGCTGAEVKQDAQVIESEAHSLIVDAETGVDDLAENPGAVDLFESLVIGPLAAQNKALADANVRFMELWANFKAGKVGPSGTPITVGELKAALAVLEGLTAPQSPQALQLKRAQRRLAAAQRPPRKEPPK